MKRYRRERSPHWLDVSYEAVAPNQLQAHECYTPTLGANVMYDPQTDTAYTVLCEGHEAPLIVIETLDQFKGRLP